MKITGKYKVTDSENNVTEKKTSLRFWFSTRFWMAIIGFVMFLHIYSHRVGMSVAIVCMVNHTALSQLENKTGDELEQSANSTQCERDVRNSYILDGPFLWPKDIQGQILASFFYGYTLSQVPGGLLAERFGAKWIFAIFFTVSTIGTILTPMAAKVHYGFLIAIRVVVGIGSGALFPVMHCFWGRWSPPLERSKLAGISYAGAMMGNVVTMPVSGVLCEYGFADGWGSIFYVFGMTSAVCLVIWLIFTSDNPQSNRFISKQENYYIQQQLSGLISEKKVKIADMPWKRIITSGPVWSLIICNFCSDWGLYTLLTNIPSFYREVLRFDIKSNGLFSALPFIGLWVSMNTVPYLADCILKRHKMSIGLTRKVFTALAMMTSAASLVALSFLSCTLTGLAVFLLTLSVTANGLTVCGFYVNHMDIAPRYAGTLLGMSNGVAATSGFMAATVAATLTRAQTRQAWQNVFFITAGMYAFGSILYCIIASGQVQPWAVEQNKKENLTLESEPGPSEKPSS